MPSRFAPVALTLVFSAAVIATLVTLGGAPGLAYALLVLALSAAGVPLGFALLGRAHAAGWVAGLLLGYAATTLAV